MPLYYADSSALVKLVSTEPETPALRTFLDRSEVISCELALTEVARSVRRAARHDPSINLGAVLAQAGFVLDSVALLPLDRPLMVSAGALDEPALRSLDGLHVAAAISVSPIDGFVTYDVRQGAAARLVGLRTIAPG